MRVYREWLWAALFFLVLIGFAVWQRVTAPSRDRGRGATPVGLSNRLDRVEERLDALEARGGHP